MLPQPANVGAVWSNGMQVEVRMLTQPAKVVVLQSNGIPIEVGMLTKPANGLLLIGPRRPTGNTRDSLIRSRRRQA